MKKAIIFGGGNISGLNIINDITEYDIICVDKGVDFARKHDIEIDIAIGDFDSASSDSIRFIKDKNIEVLTFNRDKDYTDLELSFMYAKENLYDEIYVFGAIGTRMDHTLSNINLLKTYTSLDRKIVLIDDHNYIYYLDRDEKIVNNGIYNNVSILPTNDDAIINLLGVKWELHNHYLKFGDSLTISNEFVSYKTAKIEILKGNVFVILSKD
ncbi:thiamine diphosphokinase [Helcococcus kunzii]